ncbi:MAG: hypothetical protein AAGU05_04160 [Anaerolineaceae bacterium]
MRKILFLGGILLTASLLAACAQVITPATATPAPSETPVPAPTLTPEPTATEGTGIGGESACPPAPLPMPDWPFYCDTTVGYFFQYPSDAMLNDQTGDGIVRIDLSVLPGTNLGEKYLEVSAATGQETCASPLAGGYVPEAVNNEEVEINGLTFLKQSGSDAGAGNYYNWTAYSTARDGTCVSFGFVLHSTNRYNYPTPPPEFDEAAETAVFEQILGTFRWVSAE